MTDFEITDPSDDNEKTATATIHDAIVTARARLESEYYGTLDDLVAFIHPDNYYDLATDSNYAHPTDVVVESAGVALKQTREVPEGVIIVSATNYFANNLAVERLHDHE